MFILIPFIAYAVAELRNARRRERKLWAIVEEMAARVDEVSLEVGLLAPRGVPLAFGAEDFRSDGTTPDDDAGPPRRLRVVNGGK